MPTEYVAAVCIAWYVFIACVCAIGDFYLFHHYRATPAPAAVLSRDKKEIPHVTVIRPCKGLEPRLYECLASTFKQDYPADKITIHLCVASPNDPALPIMQKVVRDHPHHDARVYVEEYEQTPTDPEEWKEYRYRSLLGPNPKIRNMSKPYRDARGDLIWITDCNVWVGRGVCARMVDRLCGFVRSGKSATPYKLVHHLPISVDVDGDAESGDSIAAAEKEHTRTSRGEGLLHRLNRHGGRLDELFLASSHAKMYVAINVVAVAPCIVGKSTMFRRSHLDWLTAQPAMLKQRLSPGDDSSLAYKAAMNGIDHFSHNICEDHLIGDLLWRSPVPPTVGLPPRMRNHGLVYGDLAVQPVADMTVADYAARRVRWLRVRKFTVPAATLVEPGTESFLCSAMGAWGVTTCTATNAHFGRSWSWCLCWWVASLVLWASVDRAVYVLLHSGRTVESVAEKRDDDRVPAFAAPPSTSEARRPFRTWLAAWLVREALALPIWTWAIWGGASVTWRNRRFWVGMDMKVHEIEPRGSTESDLQRGSNAASNCAAVNGSVAAHDRGIPEKKY